MSGGSAEAESDKNRPGRFLEMPNRRDLDYNNSVSDIQNPITANATPIVLEPYGHTSSSHTFSVSDVASPATLSVSAGVTTSSGSGGGGGDIKGMPSSSGGGPAPPVPVPSTVTVPKSSAAAAAASEEEKLFAEMRAIDFEADIAGVEDLMRQVNSIKQKNAIAASNKAAAEKDRERLNKKLAEQNPPQPIIERGMM